jgi:hypothetical protein
MPAYNFPQLVLVNTICTSKAVSAAPKPDSPDRAKKEAIEVVDGDPHRRSAVLRSDDACVRLALLQGSVPPAQEYRLRLKRPAPRALCEFPL